MDTAYETITSLRAKLQSRDLRSTDVTQLMLDRIAARPELNAFIRVTGNTAMADAARADAVLDRMGPDAPALTGVPIALKDIYDVAGQPTTGGMGFRRDHEATGTATSVRRLAEAGAVILGKTTLTEGVHAEHTHFGTPQNPWNADRWCGASSSGSAVALMAGLCYMGLASETGGSIRIPSAMNGVTGFKPTWGRVSRAGVFELAASLDHVGPLARSVEDAALTLWIMAGLDPADPTTLRQTLPPLDSIPQDVNGLRIGIDPDRTHADVDPEHVRALETMLAVLEKAGAELVRIDTPDPTDMIWDWFDVCASQTALAHQADYPARASDYGPALTDLIERGRALSAMDLQRVQKRRDAFRGAFEALFAQVDCVATPAMAFTAPTIDEMARATDRIISGLHRFTCPYTMSGHPALSMPVGVHSDGMPINAQLLGPLGGEAVLVRAGRHYQSLTDHHRRHPG